jgi:hypothetical protein
LAGASARWWQISSISVQQEGVALDSAGEVQIDKRPKLVVMGVVGGAGRTFFEGL